MASLRQGDGSCETAEASTDEDDVERNRGFTVRFITLVDRGTFKCL